MPRTRLDPEQRRAELISAARRLFTAHGVDGTAVSDIVRAAGVAQGTFYWYFRSKDDVVAAVVEQMGAAWVGRAEMLAASEDFTPLRKLALVLAALWAARPAAAAEQVAEETGEFGHLRLELDRSLGPRFHRVVTSVLDEGCRRGDFVLSHPAETAALIVAAFTGFDAVFAAETPGREWTSGMVEFVLRVTGSSVPLAEFEAEMAEVQPLTIG